MKIAWPYQFVNLTPEEVEARRSTLNQYGFYAYLSPIIILLAIYSYQTLSKALPAKESSSDDAETATEPSTVQVIFRRWKWWLAQPLTPEFGPRQVHLMGLAYAAWLLVLALRETSNDYMHVTKRFGHIAISQLPFHYMLAIKSPRSPAQSITGLSYETVLPYHRIFGRILHMFLLAHGVLYINFFIQLGVLSKRLGSWDVRLGSAALILFDILAITSIPPIRKFAYHTLFYKSHVIISLAVLPLLFFHVPYTRLYVVQCGVAAAFNAITRKSSTSIKILSHVKLVGRSTNLIRLVVPGPAWGIPPLMGAGTPGWVAGQHCYVKRDISPALPRSPFTIVSLPPTKEQDGGDESSKLELIIRNLKGPTTGWLAKKPAETGRESTNVEVMIEGPYGEAGVYVPDLVEKENGDVLLVAGGVGATFTLPIYLSLLKEIDRRKRGMSGHVPLTRERKIVFVWIVRSEKETVWVLEAMQRANLVQLHEKSGVAIDARIFVTNSKDKSPDSSPLSSRSRPQFDFPAPGISVTNAIANGNTITTQASSSKMPPSPPSTPPSEPATTMKLPTPTNGTSLSGASLKLDVKTLSSSIPGVQISTNSGRPNLHSLVTEIMGSEIAAPHIPAQQAGYRHSRITVLSCGPEELISSLRDEVGKHVLRYGRDVHWRTETFSHGG